MLDDYNEILKPAEVREILLVGKNTLYQLLNTKQLTGHKSGKNWRITYMPWQTISEKILWGA